MDKEDQLTNEQIEHNIANLRNKFGSARTGGKGSQRRKVKAIAKPSAGNDKAIKNIIKKLNAKPFRIEEVNFFKDDNTILHFKNPECHAAFSSNIFIVTGEPQTKTIRELLPDIIKQLGPKQHHLLKDVLNDPSAQADDVPDLVPTTTPAHDQVE